MVLTRHDFAKCLYYPASGSDIQPMLRFSHLVDTFVYATVGEAEEKVIDSINQKIRNVNQWKEDRPLLETASSRLVRKDQIDSCEVGLRPAYMTEAEWRGYMSSLLPFSRDRQWAREFTLKRYVGEETRMLRLIVISGEGLATYEALSHHGKHAPKIVCTIQSGVLEDDRNELFNRSIERHASRPYIWVKGSWTKPVREDPDFYNPVQTYDHWNTRLGADDSVLENPSGECSHVRAFAESSDLKLGNEASFNGPSGRKVILRKQKLCANEIKHYDCAIVSERLLPQFMNPAAPETALMTWESLKSSTRTLEHMPTMTLDEAFAKIDKLSSEKGYRRFVMMPVGFEDENATLRQWCQKGQTPIEVEVRFLNAFDFADLRGWNN